MSKVDGMQMKRAKEHFRGCLLGGAVGDALGAPVEFLSLAEIKRRFGPTGVTSLPNLGQQAIPQDWLYNLELTEEIIQIADDLLIQYRNDDEWRQKYPGW